MALFAGQFEQSIDLKNRVTIPMAFRSAVEDAGQGSRFVLVPVPGRHLWLFPAAHVQRMMTSQDPATRQEASGLAFLAAMMRPALVDARGRMVIPTKILRSADLGREVVLIGAGDHIEVWPRDEWRRRAAADGMIPGARAGGLGRGPVTG